MNRKGKAPMDNNPCYMPGKTEGFMTYKRVYFKVRPFIMAACDDMDRHGVMMPTRHMIRCICHRMCGHIFKVHPEMMKYDMEYSHDNMRDPPPGFGRMPGEFGRMPGEFGRMPGEFREFPGRFPEEFEEFPRRRFPEEFEEFFEPFPFPEEFEEFRRRRFPEEFEEFDRRFPGEFGEFGRRFPGDPDPMFFRGSLFRDFLAFLLLSEFFRRRRRF